MKIVPYITVSVLFSFMWIPMATAEPNNTTTAPDQNIQVRTPMQGEQIIPPRAGISWKEKLMMQREIKKRAAASRNTLMRQAAMERQNEGRQSMQQESVVEP